MRKISIAVCDADAAYSRKLGEWITLEKGGQFSGCSFSTPESFLEFQKAQRLDVVLLGNGFCEDSRIEGQILQAISKGENPERGFQEILWIYLHDNTGKEKCPKLADMLPVIEKYQAASGIVREIFSCCQKYRMPEQELLAARREMIGIYSPGHSVWQTPFALTLAQALGKKEKALYVNLKECAGFSGWLQEDYQHDLLDVMYLCLTGEGNISDCIGSAVYTLEGFDYIPPSEDSLCLGQVSGQDYIRFVRLLAEKSGYGIIILDFGMMVPGFSELLEMCGKVYVLGGQMELQGYSLEHFKRMMIRQENRQLEEKLSYLSLPRIPMGNCQGKQKMQQWIWGELGDYVRGLVGDINWNRSGNVY